MASRALGESVARLAQMPGEMKALWALLGMGAMLSGSLGVPLTATLFSLELTHAQAALLPLASACIASYAITSLIMPRSILTEKLSRRGYHLSREYGVDPLESVTVSEVMLVAPASCKTSTDTALPEVFAYSDESCRMAAEELVTAGVMSTPVVDRTTGRLAGQVSTQELLVGRKRAVERSERKRGFSQQWMRVVQHTERMPHLLH